MNRIKQVLSEKKISQVRLCELTGKSYESINAYVSNRRQPSLSTLFVIAEVLGVEANELIAKRQDIKK